MDGVINYFSGFKNRYKELFDAFDFQKAVIDIAQQPKNSKVLFDNISMIAKLDSKLIKKDSNSSLKFDYDCLQNGIELFFKHEIANIQKTIQNLQYIEKYFNDCIEDKQNDENIKQNNIQQSSLLRIKQEIQADNQIQKPSIFEKLEEIDNNEQTNPSILQQHAVRQSKNSKYMIKKQKEYNKTLQSKHINDQNRSQILKDSIIAIRKTRSQSQSSKIQKDYMQNFQYKDFLQKQQDNLNFEVLDKYKYESPKTKCKFNLISKKIKKTKFNNIWDLSIDGDTSSEYYKQDSKIYQQSNIKNFADFVKRRRDKQYQPSDINIICQIVDIFKEEKKKRKQKTSQILQQLGVSTQLFQKYQAMLKKYRNNNGQSKYLMKAEFDQFSPEIVILDEQRTSNMATPQDQQQEQSNQELDSQLEWDILSYDKIQFQSDNID